MLNEKMKSKPKRPAKKKAGGDCHPRLVRLVRVDMGYGPAEHWVTGKVIDTRAVSKLFSDGTATDILVETPGGERTWVSFWEEISETNVKSPSVGATEYPMS